MEKLWCGEKREIVIKQRGTGIEKNRFIADHAIDDGLYNHFFLDGREVAGYDTQTYYYVSSSVGVPYAHEAVELCPHCEGEHIEPNWSPDKGYRTHCMHCGASILLCDECLHADDNPEQRCDWDKDTGKCFRDREDMNG